jgi:hypothetical protein
MSGVLKVDLTDQQPADAAEAVSWWVHPLRKRILEVENSYVGLVVSNIARAREPKDLPPVWSRQESSDGQDVYCQRVRCEFDEHLDVLAQEQYDNRIIVFPGDANDAVVKRHLSPSGHLNIEWVQLSVDFALKERQIHEKQFLEELRNYVVWDRKTKDMIKKIVDRSLNPKFLELSRHFETVETGISELKESNKTLEEGVKKLLDRKP